MKKEFWIEKWQNNQTGFHKDFTHPLLMQYIGELNLDKGDTVFVPLCGKSIDMLWLSDQGYKVIGVEISELAIEQFFNENNLEYFKTTIDYFDVYQCGNICIYCGDFFNMLPEYTTHVKAVYDRAAFIALPEDMVDKYVDKVKDIVPLGTENLLITLEFVKTSGPVGPPFNSPDSKVKQLYSQFSSIKLLQEVDIISREDKFKQQGCDFLYERVYLIS